MNILKQNTKMKKDNIYSFGITPAISCPMADKCKQYCYACKGNYIIFPNVMRSLDMALELTQRVDFVQIMVNTIKKKRNVNLVRIHTEGDFYNQEYLDKWVKIIQACPDVNFYCYTKSLHLNWSEILSLPNFKRIQSFGGLLDNQIDLNQPNARIFKNVDELNRAGYVDCSESDLIASNKNNINIGLIDH